MEEKPSGDENSPPSGKNCTPNCNLHEYSPFRKKGSLSSRLTDGLMVQNARGICHELRCRGTPS